MVILCDKEVAILIGPTLAINLKSHEIQMWSSSSEG